MNNVSSFEISQWFWYGYKQRTVSQLKNSTINVRYMYVKQTKAKIKVFEKLRIFLRI